MIDILYMANHNLNAEISFAGFNLLVPNVAEIKQTNGVEGFGSLGLMANTCTSKSLPVKILNEIKVTNMSVFFR